MASIQNEIDAFNSTCDDIIQSALQPSIADETPLEELRGDQFLKATMKMQSEFIGRALLEVIIAIGKQVDQ